MDRVGEAMRSAFHWVPRSLPCYLVMDNAEGHGKTETVNAYEKN